MEPSPPCERRLNLHLRAARSSAHGVPVEDRVWRAGDSGRKVPRWCLFDVSVSVDEKRTGRGIAPPRRLLEGFFERYYGTLTVVPSPALVIVKVPEVVEL